MNPLQTFYLNETQREAVKQFLIEVLERRAIDKVFTKKAIAGVYEAKQTLEDAFDELEVKYGKIEGQIINNSR